LSTGLQVRLFGRVVIRRDDRPVPVLPSKALELLCYLVLHRGRAHTREALSRLLWPDSPDGHAKKYLRQTLWQLQTNLASGSGPDDPPLLELQAGRVRVSPAARWWSDVDLVERAHEQSRAVLAADPAGVVTVLEHAVGLVQGDLLEGWGQDWCLRERDRLHLLHLDLLERLTEHCVARSDLARGLGHGNRLLQLDPAREVTHRQLMRLYAVTGDRTGALRQYHRCTAALAAEFELEPDAETTALYRLIRAGHGVAPPVAAPAPAPAVLQLGERLDQIAAAVAALRSEVQLLMALQPALQPGDPTPAEGEWEAG
jgi:DNA-binding SARP family transcriptional activator